MPRTWQLQEAKNKFSEVVEKALSEGPQTISRRGVPAVVVMSVKDMEKLCKPKMSLAAFLATSPLKGLWLDLERDKDQGRNLSLGIPD